jgi:hypothetical protein
LTVRAMIVHSWLDAGASVFVLMFDLLVHLYSVYRVPRSVF